MELVIGKVKDVQKVLNGAELYKVEICKPAEDFFKKVKWKKIT